MVFSSITFVYAFFPLVAVAYYLSKNRVYRNVVLLLASLLFYSWGEPRFLLLMLAATLAAYCGGLLMERSTAHKRLILIVTVVLLVGNLFVFKYLNFFSENLSALFGWRALPKLTLPIGISFYTFQILSYVIDLYRGEIRVQRNYFYLLLYVSFFPQLIAGPIVRYETVEQEIQERHESIDDVAAGLRRFILGLAKKVILANNIARIAETIYAGDSAVYGTALYWLAAVAYALQIYFDFSGYSDMAIGLGRMFGFHFLENFDHPYTALSITDFWRRWHISLSTWFRDYVYIPLGGNRKGTARMYLNLFIVFLVSGIWHGAGWNFVLWGALHGALYLVTRAWQRRQPWQLKQPRQQCAADVHVQSGTKKSGVFSAVQHVLCVALTFLFLNFTWMLFRSANLSQAGEFVGRLIGGGFAAPAVQITEAFNLEEFWYVIKILHLDRLPGSELYLCFGFWAVALWLVFFARNAGEREKSFEPNGKTMFVTAFLMIWCVVSLSGVSSFLYYRF